MTDYSEQEIRLFKKLNSPQKIQDFLNILEFNFEIKDETCYSPRYVIKHQTAHCMEGALLAAAIFEFQGQKPLIMDLRATSQDFDHVIAVFKQFGCYGAISKTNHPVLRYREPIYRSLRELAISYFHEYFLKSGNKTLREYSDLLNLNVFNNLNWRTTDKQLFIIPEKLDIIKHYKLLGPKQIKNLRKADKIEIKVGELVEFRKNLR